MIMHVNWQKIKKLHADLISQGWKDEDPLLFIMILRNGSPKKSVVIFRELMSFFWSLTESKKFEIAAMVIQDKEGKILYRHQHLEGNEEIPLGGNVNVIKNWKSFTDEQKEIYLRILISQINAYDN
jgi:hypothetical protein